jgi:excisionase family DNA binding protein
MIGISYSTVKEIERIRDAYEKIKYKEFFSVSETAFLLSVGRATIYRYLHSNTLKAVQIQGKTFIRKSDIDAMFDNPKQYQPKWIKLPVKNSNKTGDRH